MTAPSPAARPLADKGSPDKLTALEENAKDLGLKFIELDGNVGVLANGAGLTMTTMDAIRHYGGRPANFLEIGGESYTKAKPALELVLANPSVKALLVNFCGAFARTDVMTEGVIAAWQDLKPKSPSSSPSMAPARTRPSPWSSPARHRAVRRHG